MKVQRALETGHADARGTVAEGRALEETGVVVMAQVCVLGWRWTHQWETLLGL